MADSHLAALAAMPPPPPGRRNSRYKAGDELDQGIVLIGEHAAALAAATSRNRATLAPQPCVVGARDEAVVAAFGADSDPVRASLIAEIAGMLTLRLERVVHRLRRRLGRQRTELPLRQLREMDAASLRRNSRRPGLTLLEKAGPKQRLVGVVRVEKFDTTENRVLLAAAKRIEALARAELAGSHKAQHRTSPRARAMSRLQRVCSAIIALPQLSGLGQPRAGERPSNALLGDPDYRLAWRAWRLLSKEDSRFATEWAALPLLWGELLVLACAADLGSSEGWCSAPDWSATADFRGDGSRLLGPFRSWTKDHEGEFCTVAAALDTSGVVHVSIAHYKPDFSPAASFEVHQLGPPQHSEPCDRAAALAAVRQVLPNAASSPRITELRTAEAGVSLLGDTVWVHTATGPRPTGPSAACEVYSPRGGAMYASGLAATWSPRVAGPEQLFSTSATLGGFACVKATNSRELAVVVPDAMGELACAALRRHLGSAWLIPATVAGAMAAAASDPEAWSPDSTTKTNRIVAVVIITAACCDIAWLERTDLGYGPLWVRSTPLRMDHTGHQSVESPADLGAWLRANPAATSLSGAAPRQIHKVTSTFAPLAQRLTIARSLWKGTPADAALVISDHSGDAALTEAVLGVATVNLPTSALASGAYQFLQCRKAGLPTWKDRLPRLAIRVNRQRSDQEIELIAANQLVAPGDNVEANPITRFRVPPRESIVRLPLRQDQAEAPFEFRLTGPPLPLLSETPCRIQLRFTYGQSAMHGSLIPLGTATFESLPFVIADTGGDATAARASAVDAPNLKYFPAPTVAELQTIGAAASEAHRVWNRLDMGKRKDAPKNPAVAAPVVNAMLEHIDRGMPGNDWSKSRAPELESCVALIDWLLGYGKVSGAGQAPLLTKVQRLQLVGMRGRLPLASAAGPTLQAARQFGNYLLSSKDIPAQEACITLGALVHMVPEIAWSGLLGMTPLESGPLFGWAEGVYRALSADKAMATNLSPETAVHLVATATVGLEQLAKRDNVSRQGGTVASLSRVLWTVCACRTPTTFQPDQPDLARWIARLSAVRERFPTEVLKEGRANSLIENSEPLATGISYLAGNYGATLRMENG